MHHRNPVQDLKPSQPQSTRNKRSPHQRTGLLLAIVIVNSTPLGTSVLDRLEQIIQDREQQKQQQQQEQQRCTNATKSQQATTVPQLNVDEEGMERDGGAGHRDNFSPDRTRSPSPRLREKRQQQYQWTQQSSFDTSTAGGQDQAWKLREKLLETEIETLRRWKLNRQLEEDRARLWDLETTDSCICRGGLQKVVKRRKISTPHLATGEGSAGEGSGANSDTTLLRQQQEDSTKELVEYKHRLLGHLDVIRRNQYFLEQVIASCEKHTIDREEVPTSLWNLSMTSNLILAVKEVTAMFCSPMIRFDLSERAYIHTMDAVQEYLREPFLTSGQYKNVLQVLESSWGQLLLPIFSASTEPYAETSIESSGSLPLARFDIAAQHQIHQQQQHSGSGAAHRSRCLGGLLRILLRALRQTLDAILQSNTSLQQQVEPQQRQDQPSGVGGDGGAYRFARRTRLTGKTKAAERVEQTRKSLAGRQVTRQRQQQQEERCGQMVDIACGLLSAYRQSSLFMAERLERGRERCRSGSSGSGALEESQDSADNDSSNRMCISSVDALEFKHVEDDCNRLMSSICSVALFSPDVSTTTTMERPPAHGVSVWLTTRIQRLVSIDCFQ
ncbi:hypothetical protein BGZ91_003527 [Linnemannia elongata]|nr:hypothetical protein BGZ91_003527 [Linnemannia elongata]